MKEKISFLFGKRIITFIQIMFHVEESKSGLKQCLIRLTICQIHARFVISRNSPSIFVKVFAID